MEKLSALKKSILADGIIDADEVKMLRKLIYEDGIVDRKEANFLFELNDAVSGKKNDASWKKFLIEAITSHVLDDDESPGVIDDKEAKWLISKIEGDGKIDEIEKALLLNIKKKAKAISPLLDKLFKQI
ncbi:MAG: TerB family tellurite resistance protein [Bacteroidota bacterium]